MALTTKQIEALNDLPKYVPALAPDRTNGEPLTLGDTVSTLETGVAAAGDVKAADLASTSSGKGASTIGIHDTGSKYAAGDVEAALAEVKDVADGARSTANAAAVAADLASVAHSKGASLVGIEDTGGHFTATTVEGALKELAEATPGGGGGKAILTWATDGLSPSGATSIIHNLRPGWTPAASLPTDDTKPYGIPMPFAGTLKNMRIVARAGTTGGGIPATQDVTIHKNGSATAVTASFGISSATSGSDLTHTVTFLAGDTIGCQSVIASDGSGHALLDYVVSVEIDPS